MPIPSTSIEFFSQNLSPISQYNFTNIYAFSKVQISSDGELAIYAGVISPNLATFSLLIINKDGLQSQKPLQEIIFSTQRDLSSKTQLAGIAWIDSENFVIIRYDDGLGASNIVGELYDNSLNMLKLLFSTPAYPNQHEKTFAASVLLSNAPGEGAAYFTHTPVISSTRSEAGPNATTWQVKTIVIPFIGSQENTTEVLLGDVFASKLDCSTVPGPCIAIGQAQGDVLTANIYQNAKLIGSGQGGSKFKLVEESISLKKVTLGTSKTSVSRKLHQKNNTEDEEFYDAQPLVSISGFAPGDSIDLSAISHSGSTIENTGNMSFINIPGIGIIEVLPAPGVAPFNQTLLPNGTIIPVFSSHIPSSYSPTPSFVPSIGGASSSQAPTASVIAAAGAATLGAGPIAGIVIGGALLVTGLVVGGYYLFQYGKNHWWNSTDNGDKSSSEDQHFENPLHKGNDLNNRIELTGITHTEDHPET